MVKKIWLLALLTAFVISLGFFTLKGFGKEDRPDDKLELRAISEKIDTILKNQEDIVKRLEDIRQQQDIIRIRASRR